MRISSPIVASAFIGTVCAASTPACVLACVSQVIKKGNQYTFNQQQTICEKVSSDVVKCLKSSCPSGADDAVSYYKDICGDHYKVGSSSDGSLVSSSSSGSSQSGSASSSSSRSTNSSSESQASSTSSRSSTVSNSDSGSSGSSGSFGSSSTSAPSPTSRTSLESNSSPDSDMPYTAALADSSLTSSANNGVSMVQGLVPVIIGLLGAFI